MAPELKHELDYSDFESTPDDGNRYEILRGDLFVSPPPTPYHQRASKRLQRQLEASPTGGARKSTEPHGGFGSATSDPARMPPRTVAV